MATLSKSKQHDFINQLIVVLEDNQHLLIEKGFDPGEKLRILKEKREEMQKSEGEFMQSQIAVRENARKSKKARRDAYTNASSLLDIMSGTLGKKNPLVQEIKNIRKR